MDDSFGPGGFNANTYSNEDGGDKPQPPRQTLTPVTIKQINDATQQTVGDGEFQVNNVSLITVTFVGVVRNVQDNTANLVITIEDGTGAIDVRKWIEGDSSASQLQELSHELNRYVHVTGALKEFNGKKALQNTTIRPVTDHNEILYHNLSAINNHLRAQGISAKSGPSSAGNQDFFVKSDNDGSIQDRILSVIVDNSGSLQEGVPARLISQQLNISDDIVVQNCAALIEEGKIYTGYDDSAYLAI